MSDAPQRHPGVIEELIDDEAVLLMPHAATVLVLNEVGRTIWTLIDGKRSAATIAAALCAEYEVNPEQARADTEAFLGELRRRGLLAEVS